MTRVIHKFLLAPSVSGLPAGAEPLHVAAQNGKVFLWAIVKPDAPLVEHYVISVPTGGTVPDGDYIGTTHLGPLVIHVFDLGEATA